MAESLDFASLPDDSGYIYLDSSGNAQAKIEITVVWTRSHSTSTIVTLDRSDGIGYLPIKIAESLERFPQFEGLSNLTAFNLVTESGKQLPSRGEVGKYLKPGDQIVCEISASDMWLYVRVQCPQARIELTFEVKVNRTAFVKQIRSGIFENVCQILAENGKTEEYALSDLRLSRSVQDRRLSSTNSPKHSDECTIALEDSMAISTIFDFSSCFVAGLLEHGIESTSKLIEVTRDHDESRTQDPEDILNRTLSVRKVQVKPMEVLRPEAQKKKIASDPADTKCTNCVLL